MTTETDPFAEHTVFDMRKKTKGAKTPINFGRSKRCAFEAGVSRSYNLGDGSVMLTGEIVTASGHRFHALLGVSLQDSGEHFSTGVVYRDANGQVQIVFQGDADFKDLTDYMQAQHPAFRMFPYTYRYYKWHAEDIHVDEDTGWSNTWDGLQLMAQKLAKSNP